MKEIPRNISGPTIKKLREAHELSQQAVIGKLAAYGVNMSTASLSKIETQKRGVSDVELLAFSMVLKVSVESLLNID